MITTIRINSTNSCNLSFNVRIKYNYSKNTTNTVELGYYPSSTWHVNTYTTTDNSINYYYLGELNEKNKGTMAF